MLQVSSSSWVRLPSLLARPRVAAHGCRCRSRLLSTTTTSTSTRLHLEAPLPHFGVGGHAWKKVATTIPAYELYLRQAIQKGATVIEAGNGPDAEQALVQAMQEMLTHYAELFAAQRTPLLLTSRLGYQTKQVAQDPETGDLQLDPGDVLVERLVQDSETESNKTTTVVVHNLSPSYLQDYLKTSPLAQLCDTPHAAPTLSWMPLIHNPEVQLMKILQENPDSVPSMQERQDYLQPLLHQAMDVLQNAENIYQYGIVSNGLALPSDHPLYINPEWITSYDDNDKQSKKSKLHAVTLPLNLLESRGWEAAQHLKEHCEIWAMRPLTAYPLHGGTGQDESPWKLVDYPIQSFGGNPDMKNDDAATNTSPVMYTNDLQGPPSIYPAALQTVLHHFDATELVQAKLDQKVLSVEERETLDGCKLIQSMIHDLDGALGSLEEDDDNNKPSAYKSVDDFQNDLMQRIIPLLADTFESVDEASGDALQGFFAAYAVAIRVSMAHRTRRHLLQHQNHDIPAEMRLQEYALRHLLLAGDPDGKGAVDRVIVGASSVEELMDTMDLVRTIVAEKEKESKAEAPNEQEPQS